MSTFFIRYRNSSWRILWYKFLGKSANFHRFEILFHRFSWKNKRFHRNNCFLLVWWGISGELQFYTVKLLFLADFRSKIYSKWKKLYLKRFFIIAGKWFDKDNRKFLYYCSFPLKTGNLAPLQRRAQNAKYKPNKDFAVRIFA